MTNLERAPRPAWVAKPATQATLRLAHGALTLLVTLVTATLVLLVALAIAGETALRRRRGK